MGEKRIGVVFPGQGSQYVGMGKDLYQNYRIFAEVFDAGSEICGFDITRLCFEGPLEKLTETEICQVCVFAVGYGAWRVLQHEFPFVPLFAAGHSLGEYTAFTAAEAFSFQDALTLVSKRAKFMKDATIQNPGGMIAILGKSLIDIETIVNLFEGVYISNINAPGQIVLGGTSQGIEELSKWCDENHVKYIALNVSGAFHTPLMEPAVQPLAKEIDAASISMCKFPVYANFSGEPIINSEQIKNALKRQIVSPVQWVKTIESVKDDIDYIIELGPKKVLSGLIKKIAPNLTTLNVDDVSSLHKTIEIMKL
ncbi:MAG TPA: ACP S-malonyltransferase [bacterium]|nr:ACP S-malonyltransferase [bacterium]HOL35363.1 ACP S-malonyltransferase [bacterium]HPP08842.1 ACP S-malonyltransferase [bacterium]